jgi:hypothetical protein
MGSRKNCKNGKLMKTASCPNGKSIKWQVDKMVLHQKMKREGGFFMSHHWALMTV